MRSKYIDEDTCQRIEKNLSEPYRGCWRFSYRYGLRISDIVGITRKDVDSDGFLHYKAKKTGKVARIKLQKDDVEKYVEKVRNKNRPIFPSPNHKKFKQAVSRQAVWKNIKKVCDDLGLSSDGVSPHSGRKHFAVETFENEGFAVAMNKLQHSSAGTTALYVFSKDPFLQFRKEIDDISEQIEGITLVLDKICSYIGLADERYIINPDGE